MIHHLRLDSASILLNDKIFQFKFGKKRIFFINFDHFDEWGRKNMLVLMFMLHHGIMFAVFLSYLRFYTFSAFKHRHHFFVVALIVMWIFIYFRSLRRFGHPGEFAIHLSAVSERTKLWFGPSRTAFHAREHNCWRAFHLTALKIPGQEERGNHSIMETFHVSRRCALRCHMKK